MKTPCIKTPLKSTEFQNSRTKRTKNLLTQVKKASRSCEESHYSYFTLAHCLFLLFISIACGGNIIMRCVRLFVFSFRCSCWCCCFNFHQVYNDVKIIWHISNKSLDKVKNVNKTHSARFAFGKFLSLFFSFEASISIQDGFTAASQNHSKVKQKRENLIRSKRTHFAHLKTFILFYFARVRPANIYYNIFR